MYRLYEHGSGAFGLLIVIVLVVAIGASGWYVWRQDASENEVPASQTIQEGMQKQQAKAAADPEASGWALVTSGQAGFDIRIPDGWEVINYMPSDDMRAQNIEYKVGAAIQVDEQANPYPEGIVYRFTVRQVADTEKISSIDSSDSKVDFVTHGGIKGVRYYKKYPVTRTNPPGTYPGMQQYTYEFKTKGKITYIIYNIFDYNRYSEEVYSKDLFIDFTASDPDRTDIVERAVRTLQINAAPQ